MFLFLHLLLIFITHYLCNGLDFITEFTLTLNVKKLNKRNNNLIPKRVHSFKGDFQKEFVFAHFLNLLEPITVESEC